MVRMRAKRAGEDIRSQSRESHKPADRRRAGRSKAHGLVAGIAAAALICGSEAARAAPDGRWGGWLDGSVNAVTGWSYGGRTELFLPLWEEDQFEGQANLLFLDLQAMGDSKDRAAFSGGLGFRRLTDIADDPDDPNWLIFGAHGFLDYLRGESGEWYPAAGLGGELIDEHWDLRLDYHHVFERTSWQSGGAPFALGTYITDDNDFADRGADEVRLLTAIPGNVETKAFDSFGGQVGLRWYDDGGEDRIPLLDEVRPFVGGAYYWAEGFEEEQRVYAGVEAFTTVWQSQLPGVQLRFGALAENDLDGDWDGRFFAGIRVPFWSDSRRQTKPEHRLIDDRMEDPVIRDPLPLERSRSAPTVVVDEALTTQEYDVDGVWVAYAGGGGFADGNGDGQPDGDGDVANLQTQLDQAQVGGSHARTLVVADGTYSTANVVLNSGQVLAGGNANLRAVGALTGTAVAWGDWGHGTTNAGGIDIDLANPAGAFCGPTTAPLAVSNAGLCLDTQSVLHAFTVENGTGQGNIAAVMNRLDATDVTLRFVTARQTAPIATTLTPSFGFALVDADGSRLEQVVAEDFDTPQFLFPGIPPFIPPIGLPSGGVGITVQDSDNVVLTDTPTFDHLASSYLTAPIGFSTSDNGTGIGIGASTNLTISGWNSTGDGRAPGLGGGAGDNSLSNALTINTLTATRPSDIRIERSTITDAGFDAISISDTDRVTINDVTITNPFSDGIFMQGTRGPGSSITNVTVNGFGSNALQLGASGAGDYVEQLTVNGFTATDTVAGAEVSAIFIQTVGGASNIDIDNFSFDSTPATPYLLLRADAAADSIDLDGAGNSSVSPGADCLLVGAGTLDASGFSFAHNGAPGAC